MIRNNKKGRMKSEIKICINFNTTYFVSMRKEAEEVKKTDQIYFYAKQGKIKIFND